MTWRRADPKTRLNKTVIGLGCSKACLRRLHCSKACLRKYVRYYTLRKRQTVTIWQFFANANQRRFDNFLQKQNSDDLSVFCKRQTVTIWQFFANAKKWRFDIFVQTPNSDDLNKCTYDADPYHCITDLYPALFCSDFKMPKRFLTYVFCLSRYM